MKPELLSPSGAAEIRCFYGMLHAMLRYLSVFLCVISASTVLAESRWNLSAEQWARPRSGTSLVAMAPLGEVVQSLQADEGRALVIGYPGGEEGSLWAYELRSWLVALGIPSRRIQLQSGSQERDALDLRIEEPESRVGSLPVAESPSER